MSKSSPPPTKLKILCSFGGAFVSSSGDRSPRYAGGESRIVSLDRRTGTITLSNLLSKLSDLRPGRPFTLKYRTTGAPSSSLVSIASDDDVRRMIDDHDRLAAAQGKPPRLRLFLCNAATAAAAQKDVSCGITSRFGNSDRQKRFLEKSQVKNSGSPSRRKAIEAQIRTAHVVNGIPCIGHSHIRNACGSESNQLAVPTCSLGRASDSLWTGYRDDAVPFSSKTHHTFVGNNVNRESAVPCNASRGLVGARLAPVSFNIQPDWRFNHSTGTPHYSVRSRFSGGNNASYSMVGPHYCRHSHSHFRGQRVLNRKSSMVKGNSGPRPRANISKFGQGRSNPDYLANHKYVGSSRRVLRERLPQSENWRNLLNHHNWQGSHLAEEKREFHVDTVRYHPSYLHANVGEKIPLSSGMMSVEEGFSCKRSPAGRKNSSTAKKAGFIREEQATIHHAAREDNPSNTEIKKERNFAESSVNVSHKLSNELGLAKPLNEGNPNIPFPTLHTLRDTPRKNAEDHDVKPSDDITCPQHGITTQLDDSDLCGVNSLMHNLSFSLLTELHQPSSSSPLSSSNNMKTEVSVPNVISTLPKQEIMIQLNKENMMDSILSNSILPTVNTAEEVGQSHSNQRSDTSDLRLLPELSQPPSSFVELISLVSKKDLVYSGENPENLQPTSIVETKENMEASASISKNVDEHSCNLLQLYSHLANQELQTIENSDIEEIRELGSGTHGTVFYGKWKGSDVAIKRLKPSCFSADELGKDRLVEDFWKEARLLAQLHHPNVVAFYGVVTDGPLSNLATVTEYMVTGSLKQVLRRGDRTIDRRKRLIIAMDAAFGMEYLHEKNVVHFDLKSDNLLVNMKDPQRPVCKIGDLGLSKVKQRTFVSGGVRGTIPWMAPELLTCNKTNMVTEKVDVYSFGIVMWELLTGKEPYADMRSEEIIAGIIEGHLRPEIPSWCNPACRSLMEQCWSSDPSARPSFTKIAKQLRAIAASINIK